MWHQPRSWTVCDGRYRILHVLFRWDLCKYSLPAKLQKNRKLPKSTEATKIYVRLTNREMLTGTHKTKKHFAVDHETSVAKVGENDSYARSEKTSWCRNLCVVGESKVEACDSFQKAGLPSPTVIQIDQRKEREEHKQILLFWSCLMHFRFL